MTGSDLRAWQVATRGHYSFAAMQLSRVDGSHTKRILLCQGDKAAFKSMRKRTFRHGQLSSQVLLQIENMIAEGFPPGMHLSTEDELAERFRVTRIVIREAMKILEDRGVVEVRAGRGTIVVPPNSDRVKVIFASVNGSAFYNAHSKKILLHHSPVEVNDRNNLSRIRSCMENLGRGRSG